MSKPLNMTSPKPDDHDSGFMKTTLRIDRSIHANAKHFLVDYNLDRADAEDRLTLDWMIQEAIAEFLKRYK